MKRVLIISPHFPPVNSADMHRVRQMLPYLHSLGWEAEVVTVDPAFVESYSEDPLLMESIPGNLTIHRIGALKVSFTRKVGLGSLSMRSFFSYRRKVNALLKARKFDLVFISTTAFHVMALGPYWKRRFGVPFVLDMQDPWRNDFYLTKPRHERPPKFFVAYTIDKFLEARTIPFADAIISVSKGYCDTFSSRYPSFNAQQCLVIPFGAVKEDFSIMERQPAGLFKSPFDREKINIVYVGRGGHDMQYSLKLFFAALAMGQRESPDIFNRVHCWFIGTSYSKKGSGSKTIEPIATQMGLGSCVTEITDRLPYFQTLFLLKQADVLFIPGSTDVHYTASKVFPYILSQKPLLACFHQNSSVITILKQAKTGEVVTFSGDETDSQALAGEIRDKLNHLLCRRGTEVPFDESGFEPYTAGYMTRKIVQVFDEVSSMLP